MARCRHCSSELPEEAKFCGRCGNEIGKVAHFCGRCGTRLEDTRPFCGSCGARVDGLAPAAVPVATVTAAPPTPATAHVALVASPTPGVAPASLPNPTPLPRRGSAGVGKILGVLLVLFLMMGGGALGIWYWKPWRLIWPPEKSAIDKAAWDRDMTPPADEGANARKERWTVEVNRRAQEVEAAFDSKNVDTILQLLPPPKRDAMRPLLEAKRADLDRFGKVLATRKLVAVNEFIADYQVKDGNKTYPVTFALYDGKWYLYEF